MGLYIIKLKRDWSKLVKYHCYLSTNLDGNAAIVSTLPAGCFHLFLRPCCCRLTVFKEVFLPTLGRPATLGTLGLIAAEDQFTCPPSSLRMDEEMEDTRAEVVARRERPRRQRGVHLNAPLRGRRARPLTLSPPRDGSAPRVGGLNYHTSSASRLMTPPPAPYLSSYLLM